ncbi:SusC/RagA family TonB-linked outer membrane protein [Niastella populi]|uniref:SusC/RagA family TonB-linked outer membrane protein n=1 Tax=Niastella populi TaxID=550983 RepID=UPI0009BDBD5F|nr:SusC/RagA family TonB-linked outer membrane protein [Niastella populi]
MKIIHQYILTTCLTTFLWHPLSAQEAAAVSKTDTTVVDLSVLAYEPGPFLQIRKERSVTATSSVGGNMLYRTPVPNITNTLYGLLPGLTVKQGSGEPGYDEADLFIRGRASFDNSALVIYIDGFQTTASYFNYLPPSEIESISVLKDPVTLATFGMKGANGVLWVVTKRGFAGKRKVQVQLVSGLQQPVRLTKPYGAYDYARLYNQAVSNDNYALNGYQFQYTPAYTDAQLEDYRNGNGTNVDWYDQVLRKSGYYSDANILFSGGGNDTKYALLLDYMRQRGLYDVPTNATTSNAQIQRFNVRTNLDFNFFKIFEAKVDLGGRIEDRRYPNFNGPSLWNNMARYPANVYPVKDPQTVGWSGTTNFPHNPVASLNALGYTSTHDRTLQANFNLKQKLDFITPGLYLNEAVSFNTWTRTAASKTATYARFNNGVQTTTDKASDIIANGATSVGQYDWKQINITAGYNRTFGKHAFAGALNFLQSNYMTDAGSNNPGSNTGNNIFYHFQTVSGRLHYTNNERYLAELSFGATGSDNYAPRSRGGNRWGFYPALGLGWIISKEDFLADNNLVNYLKLRAGAGLSANDFSTRGRYLYQQYYVGNGSFYTGNNSLTANNGLIQSYAANPGIFAEKSMKYNVGVDATLFNKLSVTVDVFRDNRSDIVIQNNTLMAVYGGILPYVNAGKVTNSGIEASASYNGKAGAVTYTAGAMVSYAKNKIRYMGEIPTVNEFNKATGRPIGSFIGLMADGFYDVTDFNADGTLKSGIPVPTFGAVQPGDLKYKDLDNNGRVDQADNTKIGNPELPSLTYAFNLGVSYKGFDLTALFQGVSGNSVNLLNAQLQSVAFVNNTNVFPMAGNAWAYFPGQGIDTRAGADYPRLTTRANDNNYRTSSFWIKKGAFLRLRNAELGYNLPAAVLKNIHLYKLRLYISAVNAFNWSYVGKNYDLDPETPVGYPAMKSFNAGITLTF